MIREFDGGTVATMGLLDQIGDQSPQPEKKVGRDPAPDISAAEQANDVLQQHAVKNDHTPPLPIPEPIEKRTKVKKSPPTNHPKLPGAAQDLLTQLDERGPMRLATTRKTATERCPFINRRTLDSMQQKGLLLFTEELQGFRMVRLPHHPESTEGYVQAPLPSPVNPPEIKTMSHDEKERLSRALLNNSKTLGRQKAKDADLQAATDATVRALLPAIQTIVDYAQSHGVDLLEELNANS